MTEVWDVPQLPTQLDRIEAKLDKLLAKKKPVKKRSSKVLYTIAFEKLWSFYPKRAGSNPKKTAYDCYLKRVSEGVRHDEMVRGVVRYANYCHAGNLIGGEFVMQCARFLGHLKEFENDWTIHVKQETVPKDDNKLSSWAAERGYRAAYTGESSAAYRRALKTLHRSSEE